MAEVASHVNRTPPPLVASGKPVTVLLVDDEPLVLVALRRTLVPDGYRLVETTDPTRALDIVEREDVDIVISDVDMPNLTGVDLVAQIRQKRPSVVRLLLTGGATLASALTAINQGEVFRYLTKPWDPADLRKTVKEAVARLHELRLKAETGLAVGRRTKLHQALEDAYPGITRVPAQDGEYAIDQAAVAAALEALGTPEFRALWSGEG
jgi:response regulator RpfG family c-di-GMP phosphodiesterase